MSLVAWKIGQTFKDSIKKITFVFPMVQELYIFNEPLQPRFFEKKTTLVKNESFHLKKQRWRRFLVFPEVLPF
jgi:hypothetical protein